MTQEEDIKNAVECMRKGGVILYPTDTVWGIGCDATNPEAVAKVYQIKQRDDSKALICLVDSADRMARYFRNVPEVAWQFIDVAMPVKPTTVIWMMPLVLLTISWQRMALWRCVLLTNHSASNSAIVSRSLL